MSCDLEDNECDVITTLAEPNPDEEIDSVLETCENTWHKDAVKEVLEYRVSTKEERKISFRLIVAPEMHRFFVKT
ncbi:hypothetical protein M8J76_001404 [Diaphorina citri]|nr:hypothetical protein M8J75_010633 [Diaphorina citri]KAI5740192.1 hypothetical protein M8J76_001404 [Diaphorina citri]KAI5746514.1 hypothetical protein M8J77_004324 [Diaphorina citri]